MENDKHNYERKYTLREIAGWITNKDSDVQLPDLQRGLVWNPRQVELLWDSMLRGFTIGSFILSDTEDGHYFLMDGQQRYNAIATGYGDSGKNGVRLWLDIRPSRPKGSTRSFWIKSTTTAHPWGYNNDDECSTLSAKERSDALIGFYGEEGKKKNIYNDEINLGETWPIKAGLSLPLKFFLDAPLTDEDAFCKYIRSRCESPEDAKNLPCLNMLSERLNETDFETIKKDYYPAFRRLASYRVQCDVLPKEIIEQETANAADDSDHMTPLEILFTRLNTGGTRITPDDLNYSAIKAYWGEIKDKNDEIARRIMPPSKLVMLAFRLTLSGIDGKDLKGNLSIRQIRALAKDSDAKLRIDKLYDNNAKGNLKAILDLIDSPKWLNVYDKDRNDTADAMPAFIRTSIARNSPEVFLLLMWLAREELAGRRRIEPAEAKGLALLLHWMGKDRKKAAGEIFLRLQDRGGIDSVRKGIAECICEDWLLVPYTPKKIKEYVRLDENAGRDWEENRHSLPALAESFARISWWAGNEAQEMLLFAQRRFMNGHFKMYDPARSDMWERHNRPWDYDHIIPQNWIREKGKRRAEFTEYCTYWVSRIGNVSAIPFEYNRSKGDRDAYDLYKENEKDLLFDKRFLDVAKAPWAITQLKDASRDFADVVADRTLKIYEKCFDVMAPVIKETVLTEAQSRRREMMKSFSERLGGGSAVFAYGSRDYTILEDTDWARDWVSIGVVVKNKYYVCFSWGLRERSGLNEMEVGLRKLPGKDIEKDHSDMPELDESFTWSNEWWYAEKRPEGKDEDAIFKELKEILDRFSPPSAD